MKFLRYVARCGTVALATAYALEQGNPILAQRGPAKTVAPAQSAQRPTAEIAMNIEVAWLGDPGLFTYNLHANAVADAIEISGFVQNETIRKRAVEIARTTFPGKIE